MKNTPEAPSQASSPQARASEPGLRNFFLALIVLLAAFSLPLYGLVRFALESALYSYILLIPFVSGYLVWIRRDQLQPAGTPLHRGWAASLGLAGLALLLCALPLVSVLPSSIRLALTTSLQDSLALAIYALVLLIAGLACLFLGRHTLRTAAFPLVFLVFLAPFPVIVENAIEYLLQHASAVVAQGMFELSGMPVMREITYFRLPGFSLEVAPECSGIHSTIALFLTSLIAGQLLLQTPWKRAVLAAVVLPLALLRNGFRVAVIGELCVRIGPEMIDSYIHRHGGPIFFVLSLVPFFIILYYLIRSDRRAAAGGS